MPCIAIFEAQYFHFYLSQQIGANLAQIFTSNYTGLMLHQLLSLHGLVFINLDAMLY